MMALRVLPVRFAIARSHLLSSSVSRIVNVLLMIGTVTHRIVHTSIPSAMRRTPNRLRFESEADGTSSRPRVRGLCRELLAQPGVDREREPLDLAHAQLAAERNGLRGGIRGQR